jgi:hypothetical protein
MRLRVLVAGLVAGVLFVGCGGDGASARGAVGLKSIGRFSEPVYVTSPPGDTRRVFVVERGGRIRVLVDGKRRSRPFLDIESKVSSGGERGLLSLAFAPDYATSGRFYVDYTDTNGDTRIVEYRRAAPERADPASARQLIFQRQPEPNHNGGLLLFGPDRKLYVGFGDGGGGGDRHGAHGNAQNLGTLLGKILRIDPLPARGRPYGIPASNPFVGRSGARGEIWAYGLRNPWRFTFAPGGAMVIGDVGQDAVEEIDVVRRAGANLGWRVFEGRSRYTPGERAPGAIAPALQRFHKYGNCSITGGVVVRDRSVRALYGRYLFGDFCKGVVQSGRVRDGGLHGVRNTGIKVDSLSSFGEDARGRVYVTSLSGGVYRLVAR